MTSDAAVHLIDDDDAVLRSLSFLLRAHRIPVRTYPNARKFMDRWQAAAGCILSDVRMPGMDGIELLKALRELRCPLPFLVMTGHADVPMAVDAMKAGAMDFIEKPFADDAVLSLIRRGLQRYETQRTRSERVADAIERLASLSMREREVLTFVSEGKASKVIAFDLGLSVRTVEVHRGKLMAKLGVENTASAIALLRMAEEQG